MAGILNPKNASEGGFFDDFDGTIVAAKFARTDYAGKRTDKVPVLQLTFKNEDEDDAKPFENSYSLGKAEDWAPSEDGKKLLAIGGKAMNANTNAMILFKHFETIGVPEEVLDACDENIGALVGLKAHWNIVPIKRDIKGEGAKETKVLVPTRLLALPGEAEEAPAANPLMFIAVDRVAAYIAAAKKKTVNKADLVSLVLGDGEVPTEEKNDMIKLVIDDEFLAAGPWTYAGGVLKG